MHDSDLLQSCPLVIGGLKYVQCPLWRAQPESDAARVTLLQILLNSHGCVGADGKRLTVDGSYGRNTRAAVSAGSRLLGVGDQGGSAATPVLIKELLADVDLNVITSVDLGDPNLQIDIDTFMTEGNDPIVLGGMCNGLQQMVNIVTGRARPGRVAALQFDGHGNLGRWLTISVGNVVRISRDKPTGTSRMR